MKEIPHLKVKRIESDLQALEEKLWALEPAQMPPHVRQTLDGLTDESERQWAIHDARWYLVQDQVVEFKEKNLRTATCEVCSQQFNFYLRTDPKNPHTKPLECAFCLDCADTVERRQLSQEFFKQHRSARFYLRNVGSPPRPVQFGIVTSWQPYLDSEANLKGIIASGGSGTGKTTALYRLFHRLAMDSDSSLIIDGVSLGHRIVELSRGTGESVQDWFWNLAESYYCLGIDDLDKARFSPRVASEVYRLIEFWCREREQPLFLTLNSSAQELAKLFPDKIGPAVVARLSQHCQHVNFDVTVNPQPKPLKTTPLEPEYEIENENENVETTTKNASTR